MEQGTPEACLFIKAVKKVAKTVRINFFRSLKINQKLAATRRVLIQEKWLIIGKNRALQHFNSPWFYLPLPSLVIVLEIISCIPIAVLDGAEGPHLQRIAFSWSVWRPPGIPGQRVCLYLAQLQTHPVLRSLPGGIFVEIFTGKYFIYYCLRQWITVETNNRLTKKLGKKV